MKKLLFLTLLHMTACASQDSSVVVDNPEEMAQKFMNRFFTQHEDVEDWVIADVAFLGYNTQNSAEGQKRIHESLTKMAGFLRESIEEVGIDSKNLVFKPAGKTFQNEGQLANVTLHIFEPNHKEEVNAMELITRWRKIEKGWKLDLNPYLDNFRDVKK